MTLVRLLTCMALLAGLILAPGCAIVPRYQRESLADPAMDPGADVLEGVSTRKFRLAREAASGGDGTPAGGGCGCGN